MAGSISPPNSRHPPLVGDGHDLTVVDVRETRVAVDWLAANYRISTSSTPRTSFSSSACFPLAPLLGVGPDHSLIDAPKKLNLMISLDSSSSTMTEPDFFVGSPPPASTHHSPQAEGTIAPFGGCQAPTVARGRLAVTMNRVCRYEAWGQARLDGGSPAKYDEDSDVGRRWSFDHRMAR